MINLKSIKNFFIVNGFISTIGLLQYYCIKNNFNILFIFLIRNILILKFINYGTRNKENINKKINKNKNTDLYFNFFTTTFVEALTHIFIKKFLVKYFKNNINFNPTWILISFMYEIIFDFFHYITHYYLHYNKFLYVNIHKKHHKFYNPTSLTAFYQHPIDLLITNSLPTILSLMLIPEISYLQFNLITIYKIFIEICGHTGKKSFPTSSFPQFIWLPKLLNIELYTEDHNLHHSKNNCNYSKRFSLWDRLFNTFTSSKPTI